MQKKCLIFNVNTKWFSHKNILIFKAYIVYNLEVELIVA